MVRAGLAACVLLAVALHLTTDLGFFSSAFLPFLLVGLPVLSFAQLPLLSEVADERVSAYVSSVVALLVIGSIALLLGWGRFGPDAMGLAPGGALETLSWTAALLVVAGLLILCFWLVGRVFGLSESPILRQLLPQTAAEKGLFAVLSVAAGVCEELAYRAFAILALGAVIGSPWLALTLATVSFSMVHAYQGVVGLARTYLLGIALGASYLIAGSLWPAMIAHTVLDLAGGLVFGERLLGTPVERPAPVGG